MAKSSAACAPLPVRSFVVEAAIIAGAAVFLAIMAYLGAAQELRWPIAETLISTVLLLLFVHLAPRRLRYRASPSRLYIRTFVGGLEIPKGNVRRVRLVNYRLGLKSIGSEFRGYYVGGFRSNLGSLRAFVSRKRGPGVLLELKDGGRVLLNPSDPAACLRPLRQELEESDD